MPTLCIFAQPLDKFRHSCYDEKNHRAEGRKYMIWGIVTAGAALLLILVALLHAQRQAARRSGVAFWNVFGAMGGENSMIRFVENNWASKDYTHLSFRGGKEIASALLKAILLEKEFYDEADKVAH
jgi:hypothetical protein